MSNIDDIDFVCSRNYLFAGVVLMQTMNLSTIKKLKTFYPQVFHGRGKNGEMVSIEKVGHMNASLMLNSGISLNDLENYIIICHEYLKRVERNLITILDMSHFEVSRLFSSSLIRMLRATSAVVNKRYATRVKKIVVINMPPAFSSSYWFIENILPRGLSEKIVLVRNHDELWNYVCPETIPKEYHGTSPDVFGNAAEELAFLDHLKDEHNTLFFEESF